MKTDKFRFTLTVIFIVFIIGFIVMFVSRMGDFTESAELILRNGNLERLRLVLIERNTTDLYQVFLKEKTASLFSIPPYNENRDQLAGGPENVSISNFYATCEYGLIHSDNNWWAVVELKSGKKGKYYLMITKDGEIIKMKEAFLPEQIKHLKKIEK
ncbi:MAG: hypothetical protein WCV67_10385 [Victivallaceae bacterium]|jgi:hypothetical protein